MESRLKECLPPKMKGFTIMRQAKLTPHQAKHLHFHMPTRGLEADRMVDVFNRLDQTDALVEQILGDRAKLEQNSNRAHAHTSHFLQQQSMSSVVTEKLAPIHQPSHAAELESGSHLDWDLEAIPSLTKTGQLWCVFQKTDSWTKLKQVRCQHGHKVIKRSVTGRGHHRPESSRFVKKVHKTLNSKRQPRRDRNVRTPFRERTKEQGAERITGAELRKRTRCYRCQQVGHMARECQKQTTKDHPQGAAKVFFHAR